MEDLGRRLVKELVIIKPNFSYPIQFQLRGTGLIDKKGLAKRFHIANSWYAVNRGIDII